MLTLFIIAKNKPFLKSTSKKNNVAAGLFLGFIESACLKIGALFFICNIFFVCGSFAQNLHSNFETINVNEGLSQSYVYEIYQDKVGYMWFNTADGLNRYDGEEVKTFKYNGKPALNLNFIRGKLCEDANGNLWYSNEFGIFMFNPVSETIEMQFDFDTTRFKKIGFETIFLDSTNTLWLTNNGDGYLGFNIQSKIIRYIPFITKSDFFETKYNVRALQKKRFIWQSFISRQGLYRFDMQTWRMEQFFKGKIFSALFACGDTLITAQEGLVEFYDQNLKLIRSLDFQKNNQRPGIIHHIFMDKFNRLWLGTIASGLWVYDFASKKLTNFHHVAHKNRTISSNIIKRVYADRFDNLWIGTDGGGVCKIDLKPPKFHYFPGQAIKDMQHNSFFTKSLFEDEQKRIWFGTTNGFGIYDPINDTLFEFSDHTVKNKIRQSFIVGAIFKDKYGTIWIGSNKGLEIYDEARNVLLPVTINCRKNFDHPNDNVINRIIQLSDGNLLAATKFGIVLVRRLKNGNYFALASKDKNGKNEANDLIQTNSGAIFSCSNYTGLKQFKIENDSVVFVEKYLTNMDFRSLIQDSNDQNILWLGSGIGLIRFEINTGNYAAFGEKDGLANDHIYGVLQPHSIQIWMSSNGGLSAFDKNSKQFTNYSFKDGLQSNEFNTNAFFKGASGNLYFGGINGFNWFNPLNFRSDTSKPGVAISKILINDTINVFGPASAFSPKQILNYNQNNFVFQFSALDYTMPQANKIIYRLENWDKNWITTYSKTVRYSKMPPGNYILKVKSMNREGVLSDEKQFAFTINPPFWQRAWFYFLLSVIVLLAIIFITRNIVQRKFKTKLLLLEKEMAVQTERQRISREMHDDIGAGLTQITLMSEAANQNRKMEMDFTYELEQITSSCRALIGNMGEIIWSMSHDNNSIEELLVYLRERLNKLLDYAQLNYSIDFPENPEPVFLSNEQQKNILLVTREIVNNAIKHSQASQLLITAQCEKNKIIFEIKDNGRGFDTEAEFSGNGLRNIRERIEDIDGTFQAGSEIGKGSRFVYAIPFSTT